MPNVIGLTGAKGSGKDLVGSLIKKNFPDARTIAFADPIKLVINHLFGLNLADLEEYDSFKRSGVQFTIGDQQRHVSGRHLVREVGMLMRKYDVHQFVRYVEKHIRNNPDKIWIVTDVRFDNEMQSLRNLGAIIFQIERSQAHYDGHVTETKFGDKDIDYVIDNNGTIDELEDTIVHLLNKVLY